MGGKAWMGILVFAWVAIGPTAPVAAQGVLGHLYDFESGLEVASANVVMTDVAGDTVGRAVSDESGRFLVLVQDLGEYSLFISRLGYVSQVSARISLEDATLKDLEMMIKPEAVGIEGLVVSADRRVVSLARAGYYERKKTAIGDFIQPTDAERVEAFSPSGLLRSVSGIRISKGVVISKRGGVGFNNECRLKVLVDGIDRGINLDEVVTRYHVSAIEVYKSLPTVPGHFLGTVSMGSVVDFDSKVETCGAVVVWTKRAQN